MIQRELNVLVLGEVDEADGMFEWPMFTEELPVDGRRVHDRARFSEALEASENYDLIVADLDPEGLEVVDQVREYRPAAPVVAVANFEDVERALEAERRGLERFVLRMDDLSLNRRVLAEAIRTELKRFVEPPSMERPSADQMYRYAHFHNVIEPFFVVGMRRHLIYVNRAGREFTEQVHGYQPVVGDAVGEWSPEPSRELCQKNLDRAFAGHEVVNRHGSGEEDDEKVHELYYRPLVDPAGRVVAVTIGIHDPGRPQLQRARATQAVTRFAGGVAHQMNNLLNVLTANFELLDEQIEAGDEGAVAGRFERVHHALDRAAQLTHQMQAFSRTAVTQREVLVLEEVVDRMREQLRETAREAIELEFVLGEGAIIRADPEQVEMAVTSLVSNAIEASEPGALVCVRTQIHRVRDWQTDAEIGDGIYAVLEVEDEGEGIDRQRHEQVFEPFYTTRRAEEHVGLGLAIVRTVVEQAGGGVEIDSEPGEGTAVRAYFPVQRTETPLVGGEDSPPPVVLLVEDDPDLRESYGELLRLDGCEVVVAGGTEEALEAAGEDRSDEPIDIVVTDVMLPDGHGRRLAEQLIDRIGPVPVVFVSGYKAKTRAEIDEIEEAPTMYLSKPFRVEALLTTVADMLTESPIADER